MCIYLLQQNEMLSWLSQASISHFRGSGHFKYNAEKTKPLHFQLIAIILKSRNSTVTKQNFEFLKNFNSPKPQGDDKFRAWILPITFAHAHLINSLEKQKDHFHEHREETRVYLGWDMHTHSKPANSMLFQCSAILHTKLSLCEVT